MSKHHIIHQLSKVKPSILYHQTSNRVKSVSSNSNNIICLENKFTKKNMSNHFGLVCFWLFKTKPFCWVGSPWTPLFFGAYGEILSESTKLSGSRSPRGFLLLQTLESLQWGYPASRHGFNGLTKTSKKMEVWLEDGWKMLKCPHWNKGGDLVHWFSGSMLVFWGSNGRGSGKHGQFQNVGQIRGFLHKTWRDSRLEYNDYVSWRLQLFPILFL